MPSIRRRTRRPRREWTDNHRCQLQVGYDHFASGWGCPSTLMDSEGREAADAWPNPETLEEMRQAWADCRESLLADPQNTGRRPFFGELTFDHGMAPRDALHSCGR